MNLTVPKKYKPFFFPELSCEIKMNPILLSRSEFKRICPNLTPEQREAAFAKFDQDKTGKINYKEFCSMMNSARKKWWRKEKQRRKKRPKSEALSERSVWREWFMFCLHGIFFSKAPFMACNRSTRILSVENDVLDWKQKKKSFLHTWKEMHFSVAWNL